MGTRELRFPPFRLDLVSRELWRGTERLALRPKTFAVLRHLVERANDVVTREDLVTTIWQDAHGSDALPKGCIRELRHVLGDDAGAPRFIETVGRRGYRFVAPVSLGAPLTAPAEAAAPPAPVVGRDDELARMLGWFEQALAGERRVVFVAGEPGIGKTTFVHAFLARLPRGSTWVARGQCVEQYGVGEAYFPVLEALGRLCRQPDGDRVVALLARHAPTWLSQMPGLLDDAGLEALRRRAQGASRERMLREMAEAVEAIAAERPLVLVLEDLQWSDRSTVELLSALARRLEPARLIVIGTFRPAELIVSSHPLKAVRQDLRVRGLSAELPLRFLSPTDVTDFLAARFPGHEFPSDLTATLHRVTDGNPLFVVSLVEYLLSRGAIRESGGRWRLDVDPAALLTEVPESLRELVERQIDQLAAGEQRTLAAASVAGVEFAPAAVAACLDESLEVVEEHLTRLARPGLFVRARAGVYEFAHALHQRVLYDRLGPAARVRLHGTVGEWLEREHGERAGGAAAELAVHFEAAKRYPAAAYYCRQAAENALRRYAHREAIDHLARALELLGKLPSTPERVSQELSVVVTLGASVMAIQGHAIPAAERLYGRARELCRGLGRTPLLLPVLRGLQRAHLVGARLREARELAVEYLRLAERLDDPVALPEAYLALGQSLLWSGEIDAAAKHLTHGIALHDPARSGTATPLVLQDAGVACRFYLALAHWLLGRVDQALAQVDEMCSLARDLGHPYTLAYATSRAALVHQVRRDVDATRSAAEAALAAADAHGFELVHAQASLLRGWALGSAGDTEGGLALMRRGLAAWEANGAALLRPYYLALIAEPLARAGRSEEALALLAEARDSMRRTGERWWATEIHRLTGEVLLHARGDGVRTGTARVHLRRALAVARRQRVRSLELRAALSLCRSAPKAAERTALGAVYRRFKEGFGTPDLEAARSLLEP